MNQSLKIQPDTVIQRASGIIAADMDGEKAMMSVEKGKYYGLDAIGSRIWELTAQPITVRAIIRILTEEYDVEEDTCLKDVCVFLNKMAEEGLIAIA